MYDASFNPNTLSLFADRDYDRDPNVAIPAFRTKCIVDAYQLAIDGFTCVHLKSHNLKGNLVYQTSQWSDELVIRKLEKNIKKITRVRQSSRLDIIRNIRALCSEGIPYRVYKLDIKRFYESVDIEDVISRLQSDIPHTPTTIRLASTLLRTTSASGISGLPRGLALSATLSEYLLRHFDNEVRQRSDVYYFARFVDDMVVITRGEENPKDFLRLISRKLPTGLKLNWTKTRHIDFSDFNKTAADQPEGSFDFLGYEINVNTIGKNKQRRITLDLAIKKMARTKTRLVLSLRQYVTDGNYTDLEDRIRLLTGNYSFLDHRENQFRKAGIFYNYRLIDTPSPALEELDVFLKKLVLSTTGSLCATLSGMLSAHEKRKLLRYSFVRGFANQHHFDFDNARLEGLMRCWKYV